MLKTSKTGSPTARFLTTLLILTALLITPNPANSDEEKIFSAFIQQFATGRIDWDRGIIYGTGRAYLDQNANVIPMAMRAAQLVAAGNILKIAAGVNLDDRRKLGELGDGNFVIRLKAFLRFVEDDSRLVDNVPRPYYEVTRKTHLTGISGLNMQILKQMQPYGETFQLPQKQATPVEERDDDPWLVLDARNLPAKAKLQPALFPKVTTRDGQAVYHLGAVNPAALEQRPMASYVETAEDLRHLQSRGMSAGRVAELAAFLLNPRDAVAQESNTRKKRGRFIVKEVTGLAGLSKTNLVISQSDAEALQAEDAASRILQNCRVIVIVSSPVGGVEGQLRRYLSVRN